MSLNGAGVYQVNSSGQPVVANTLITAATFNAFTADIATALSSAVFKDGQQTITSNIPMGGFLFSGLGAGVANGQSLRYEQLFNTSTVTLLGPIAAVTSATITSTDAGATDGPLLDLYRDSASPAANDLIGTLRYFGRDSAGNKQQYADIIAQILDPTSTTEYGALALRTIVAGTYTVRAFIGAGLYTPSATGGDKGADTINAVTLYQNGTALTALATTTPGTGVATALAINVGTAGSPVVNGGALATPASGVLTNCTGVVTLGTPVSASGTSVDFSSLPTGIRRIDISVSGLSTNGASSLIVQIGNSTPATSGYLGSCVQAASGGNTAANHTDGLGVATNHSAARVLHGTITLTLLNSSTNLWGMSSLLGNSDIAATNTGGSSKALSGVLDVVRITTAGGADTFDAGSINISYQR